ncbi:MAG: hypothetical protein ACREKN_09515 [Longimicrobiaceae bacterium]
MTKKIATLLLLLLLPLAASAQEAAERVERAYQRARAAGVPVELLEQKVLEGRAKRIPPARVAAAVERRLESLRWAQRVAGQSRVELDAGEFRVAADALEGGVGEAALGVILETAPKDRRAVAVAVLIQLVAMGEGVEVALRRVSAALERGPQALQNLPARAAAARRGAGPPAGVGPPAGTPGPPAGVPGPGNRPGGGRPPGAGPPDSPGPP